MKEVLARKRSEDSAQEALREHKSQWNRAVSDFIDRSRDTRSASRLIALKRALNGHPVPELGLTEKGTIKEPLPDVISQTLDRLAGEYQQMAQEFSQIVNSGKGIVQEQLHYSQNRQQPMTPEQRQQALMQMQQQQLPQESVASAHDELIKEAANPLTRLWAYIRTPFQFGDDDRFARKNILQSAADIQTRLIEVANRVLTNDSAAIHESILYAKDMVHLFNTGIRDPLIELNRKYNNEEIIEKEPGEPNSSVPEGELVERKTVPLNEKSFEIYIKPKNEIKNLEELRQKYPDIVGIDLGKYDDGNWYVIGFSNKEEVFEENKEEKSQPTSVVEEQVAGGQDNPDYPEIFDLSGDGADELDKIIALQNDVNQKYTQIDRIVGPIYREQKALNQSELLPDMDEAFAEIDTLKLQFDNAIQSRERLQSIQAHYNEFINLYQKIIEMAAVIKAAEQFTDDDIKKFAQGRVSRWMRRQWQNIVRGRDHRLRLAADAAITETDKALNELMNLLQQKNAPLDETTKAAFVVSISFGRVLELLVRLADMNNNKYRIDKSKGRPKGNYIERSELTDLRRMTNDISKLRRFVHEEKEKEKEEKIQKKIENKEIAEESKQRQAV